MFKKIKNTFGWLSFALCALSLARAFGEIGKAIVEYENDLRDIKARKAQIHG